MIGWGLGLVGGGIYAISMARSALRPIRAKPAEVTGRPMSLASIVFGALAGVAGAAWAVIGVLGMGSGRG